MRESAAPAAEPSPPPPPARVEITAGGHQVVVEAVAPLNTVAKKALDLWRETDNPAVSRAADTVGFSASEPIYAALLPPEVDLPHRVATSEGRLDRIGF
jgi:hypothetical protein